MSDITMPPRTTPAYNYAAMISGALALAASASVAAGHPALSAIFTDPATATALTAVIAGIFGLASAFLPAIVHPSTATAIAAGTKD
jgi:hypothetical protein